MKYIVIAFLLFTTLFSAEEQPTQNNQQSEQKQTSEEDKSGLGIGLIVSESKYEGIDSRTMVIPLIKYNQKDFYIRGIEFGYKYIDTKTFKLNFVLDPRLENYDSSDSSYLSGMEDRDMTLEAGAVVVYKPHPLLNLSSKVKFDTLGVHKGYDVGFAISSFIPFSKTFYVAPIYRKVYLSSNLANYYYGVKDSEATATRSAYEVGKTSIDIYSLNFIYKATKTISTNLMVSQTDLSQKIKNSPIIKDKDFISLVLGVSYTF